MDVAKCCVFWRAREVVRVHGSVVRPSLCYAAEKQICRSSKKKWILIGVIRSPVSPIMQGVGNGPEFNARFWSTSWCLSGHSERLLQLFLHMFDTFVVISTITTPSGGRRHENRLWRKW